MIHAKRLPARPVAHRDAFTMHLGVLQFELLVHDGRSLKDKRRVVRSIKDRLHREHLVSVAEVAALHDHCLAVMGLSLVSRSPGYIDKTFDKIIAKLRSLTDAELGDVSRDILCGTSLSSDEIDENGEPLWTPGESREGQA